MGLTRVNGRDFFHHPGKGYWRRVSAGGLKTDGAPLGSVAWNTVYEQLGEDGRPVLREVQRWTAEAVEDRLHLDLEWQVTAGADVVLQKYDYGGLFLRMPWRRETHGTALNSEGKRNRQAEGQRAKWVDVGMPIQGCERDGHIAIFDHPKNDGFPQPWRVDGQLGIGPALTRAGDRTIAKDEVLTMRHRLVVYTGECDPERIQKIWDRYAEQ